MIAQARKPATGVYLVYYLNHPEVPFWRVFCSVALDP